MAAFGIVGDKAERPDVGRKAVISVAQAYGLPCSSVYAFGRLVMRDSNARNLAENPGLDRLRKALLF